MTRDLPFSDDDAADDNGGDAAYRIATGVARVARAGAYVTGGALVAASGSRGSNAAITHDSKSTGWSGVNDPQPNVPSPTVTFPDLTADQVPAQHLGPSTASPVSTPFGPLDDYHHGTDAGLFPASFDSLQPDLSLSGFHGLGLPDGETGLPASTPHWGVPLENPATDLVSTPTQPVTPTLDPLQPNFLQSLPGFALPGTPGMHLPGTDGAHLPDLAGGTNPFDGVGATDGQGVGAFLGTQWTVDAHVGPDGVWFHSDLKVDLGVGHVMDQYNQFTQHVSQGLSHPAGADLSNVAPGAGQPTGTPASATPAASNAVPGQSTSPVAGQGASQLPGQGNSPLPGQGTSGLPGQGASGVAPGTGLPSAPGAASPLAGAPSPVAGASGPVAAQPGPASIGTNPFLAPTAPAAPVPFTPVATPAATPVVPVAAPVAVAPVAVAQPVAVTPLQTTIQPDAANQPIANLLSTHGGPSPLTAPAAVAPALFDHGKLPALATGDPSAPGHPVTLANQPATPAPVPVPAPQVSTPAKIDPAPVLTLPTLPAAKIPTIDPDVTKPGGNPVTTPAPTVPTTKLPDPDATKPDAGTPTVPTDVPVPSHQPSATVPVHPTPDVPVPTVAPTQPEVPTHQPTVSVAPAPTVAPVPTMPQPITTPPHVDAPQPVKPIADHYDSGDHLLGYHDAGLLTHDGGLFTPLLPDATFVDAHSPVVGPGDHHMLLL
ncbi:hypothetical protein ACFXHA_15140 [Nocardia sp. NPDC059240]|uniref:hypothetical protein n=1 Tax=Nocardia sp. NPDC059240 TaxID=3346786 RepID=UPI00368DB341